MTPQALCSDSVKCITCALASDMKIGVGGGVHRRGGVCRCGGTSAVLQCVTLRYRSLRDSIFLRGMRRAAWAATSDTMRRAVTFRAIFENADGVLAIFFWTKPKNNNQNIFVQGCSRLALCRT
jgi:hypothetical protein